MFVSAFKGRIQLNFVLLLALFASPLHSAPSEAAEALPRFAITPFDKASAGAGRLRSLEQHAESESFISRLFGTDCYARALKTVQTECRQLNHDTKTRLAVGFANCHLHTLGKRTYACTDRMSLKECVNHNDNEFYFAHLQFFSEIDSMCLFVQNQDFQRHTEHILNLLHAAGADASQRLVSVNASLNAHGAALTDVSCQLTAVALQQDGIAAAATDSLASLDALHDRAGGLNVTLQQSLATQKRMVEQQMAAARALRELEEGERAVLAATMDLRALAHDSAVDFLEQQRRQGELQQAMLTDLRDVAEGTRGVATALHAVARYQRRSDAVLVHLLGRSYGASDVLFYVAGASAAAAAGVVPWTSAARLPLLALFGGALTAERCLPHRLHRLLSAGDEGQVVLKVPLPSWLAALPGATATEGLSFDFKWLVRRLALAAAAACLVTAAFKFRVSEQSSVRLLQQIEARQKAQDEAQEELGRHIQAALLRERIAVLSGVADLLSDGPPHLAGLSWSAKRALAMQGEDGMGWFPESADQSDMSGRLDGRPCSLAVPRHSQSTSGGQQVAHRGQAAPAVASPRVHPTDQLLTPPIAERRPRTYSNKASEQPQVGKQKPARKRQTESPVAPTKQRKHTAGNDVSESRRGGKQPPKSTKRRLSQRKGDEGPAPSDATQSELPKRRR